MFQSTRFPLTLAGEGEGQMWKCVTAPNDDTPEKLGFKKDFDLKMAIGDEGDDVMVYGTHWTHHLPCLLEEASRRMTQQITIDVEKIDDSRMPSDRLTYAVVVALEELADNSTCDSNTRAFAWMYAKHTRATDMTFKHLLHTQPIANMAAAALDAWTVRHPIFRAQAHEAQDMLINVLHKYKPTRPKYEPYWTSNGKEGTREGKEGAREFTFREGDIDSTTLEG